MYDNNNIQITQEEQLQMLPPEDDYGTVEYKFKLQPDNDRFERLVSQMKFRIQEGNGECFYEVGVADNGSPIGLSKDDMKKSLETLCQMGSILKADIIVVKIRPGIKGQIAEVLVRKNQKEGIKLDIRIMLLGDHLSGKSTLVGVLTTGLQDNGKGSARMKIMSHKHEVLSGVTSSISHHILGFDSQGNITNHCNYKNPSWEEIIDQSTKLMTFIDLGGHQKYVKMIVSGLCSQYPEYALMIISAKDGITKTAEEHFKLALVFQVPIIIVITHIDAVEESRIDETVQQTTSFLKAKLNYKIPLIVRNEEDVVLFSRTLYKECPLPIFLVSNKTGKGLDLFISFLNLLPLVNEMEKNVDMHTEFYVHAKFELNGMIVLAGTVIKGKIKMHQLLQLGPDEKGVFRGIEVLSIQCKKVAVRQATCGQSCTIAIKPGNLLKQWLEKSSNNVIRKGMVLVENRSMPKAAYEFLAEIMMYDSQSEKILRKNYKPIINSQTTRQACKLIISNEEESDYNDQEEKKLNDTDSISLKRIKSKSIDTKVIYRARIRRKRKYTKKNKSQEQKLLRDVQKLFLESEDTQKKQKKKLHKKSVEFLKEAYVKVYPNIKNLIRLRFLYYPEYITKGQKIIINDSSLKAIGVIKEIY